MDERDGLQCPRGAHAQASISIPFHIGKEKCADVKKGRCFDEAPLRFQKAFLWPLMFARRPSSRGDAPHDQCSPHGLCFLAAGLARDPKIPSLGNRQLTSHKQCLPHHGTHAPVHGIHAPGASHAGQRLHSSQHHPSRTLGAGSVRAREDSSFQTQHVKVHAWQEFQAALHMESGRLRQLEEWPICQKKRMLRSS